MTDATPGLDDLPAPVRRLMDGATASLVWTNELGGRTFRLEDGGRTRYLKWQRRAGLTTRQLADVDLVEEARRLGWAGRFLDVPQVLACGSEDDGAWLLTDGIEAENPLAQRWRTDPLLAVPAIARGLRRLHDTLPVARCPFTCRWLDGRLADSPEPERLVVCHGDPCVPNTLLDDHGDAVAHVDLGGLGVADRWADLAIASMSIGWDINFGPGHEELFFQAYGVEPDRERISFYRRLWEG
ncbi:aminoglycoside 3'-phosphotransferase [Nesterenkonia xinjiangensis]|uniref:Kanamycin kinase n=1 Tax=Nesterenkonia xinjiangensis TaxID=225327 RepID=A0A7Z0GMM9_9MICC|nr:aminoglycoside 3'-phosphotransferase [Nesterenkonia xinjiangensis]NYJ77698.1 kanamycin kinase [Nesterenkonia xinjiangensis]